jgi:hypothetical protein
MWEIIVRSLRPYRCPAGMLFIYSKTTASFKVFCTKHWVWGSPKSTASFREPKRHADLGGFVITNAWVYRAYRVCNSTQKTQ